MSTILTKQNFLQVFGQVSEMLLRGKTFDLIEREEEKEMSTYDYVVSGKVNDPSENAFTIDTSDPNWKNLLSSKLNA